MLRSIEEDLCFSAMGLCMVEDIARELLENDFFHKASDVAKLNFPSVGWFSFPQSLQCWSILPWGCESPKPDSALVPTQARLLLLYYDNLSQAHSKKLTYLYFYMVKSPYPHVLDIKGQWNNSQTSGYRPNLGCLTYTMLGSTRLNYVVLMSIHFKVSYTHVVSRKDCLKWYTDYPLIKFL